RGGSGRRPRTWRVGRQRRVRRREGGRGCAGGRRRARGRCSRARGQTRRGDRDGGRLCGPTAPRPTAPTTATRQWDRPSPARPGAGRAWAFLLVGETVRRTASVTEVGRLSRNRGADQGGRPTSNPSPFAQTPSRTSRGSP